MDYNNAVKHYIDLRDKNAAIEAEANKQVAENKTKMEQLAVFIELKAQKDGLDKVNTDSGTVFWTTGARCNVIDGQQFFEFVQQEGAWELLEKRAAKNAVGDYIETHKVAPPGVNYVTVKQINVRRK